MRDDARPGIRDVKTLYAWVIEDVVSRMRSEFLQEGLDESVLHELRQVWEEKLDESGVLKADDVEETAVPAAASAQQLLDAGDVDEEDVPLVAVKAEQQASMLVKTEQLLPGFATSSQQQQQQQQQALKRKANNENGEAGGKRPMLDLNEPMLAQTDGAADALDILGTTACQGQSRRAAAAAAAAAAARHPAPHTAGGVGAPPQGPQGRCDMQQLSAGGGAAGRVAEQLAACSSRGGGGGGWAGGPLEQTDGPEDGLDEFGDAEEEQPLNEDDDLNDDDEGEEQGPSNALCAQYENINRVKNKWKCVLKEGVFHINGRDYVFRRATTEFQF